MVSSSLALFSLGKTTGMVLDSGYQSTNVIPVYEGYAIPFGLKVCKIGGDILTRKLIEFFKE